MSRSQVVERMSVQPESLFYHEHLARYRFAVQHMQPGRTLDIASGTGYGANLLSQTPGVSVVGADLDQPAMAQARRDYPDGCISFMVADGCFLPFRDACFDSIVTLETLEHIDDDHGYLRELTRVLRPDGVCILSTPNKAYSLRHRIVNPYHVREYVVGELLDLLGTYFAMVELYYQGYSAQYHDRVRGYAASIQAQKRKLNPVVQFLIRYIYRPVKQLIPTTVVNAFIRRLLGLSYPQPDLSDITISPEPIEDPSVFIVLCRQPRDQQQISRKHAALTVQDIVSDALL